jgi:hypothetical protein
LPQLLLDGERRDKRTSASGFNESIHARGETVDEKQISIAAFLDGQNGIVAVKRFNEGLERLNVKTNPFQSWVLVSRQALRE